jgi:hypothetical protein
MNCGVESRLALTPHSGTCVTRPENSGATYRALTNTLDSVPAFADSFDTDSVTLANNA